MLYRAMSSFVLGEGEGRPSMCQVCYKMIPLCVKLRQILMCMVVFNFYRLLLEHLVLLAVRDALTTSGKQLLTWADTYHSRGSSLPPYAPEGVSGKMNSVLKHTFHCLVFLLQLHRLRIFQYLKLVGISNWPSTHSGRPTI